MSLVVEMFAVSVFVAVFLLIEGGYTLWRNYQDSEVKRLEQRLGQFSMLSPETGAQSLMKQRVFSAWPVADALLRRFSPAHSVDRWLQQTGRETDVGNFLVLTAVSMFAGLVAGGLLRFSALGMLIMLAVGAVLPYFVLQSSRTKRLQKFDEQLPEVLDLISRALRAGHAFPSAIQMVGTEAQEPIAGEFRKTFEEINYGIPLTDAMKNLADRVPSIDLRYFIVAVILQRETGGNLAELLGNLGTLIRERFKLIGRIRVLSAEGKMSGYILGGLPFAVAAMIFMTNREFLSVLWTDPAGPKLVGGAAVLMLIGAIWMRQIIRIKV